MPFWGDPQSKLIGGLETDLGGKKSIFIRPRFIHIVLSCLLLSHLLYLLCIRLRTVTGYMCDGMTLRELWSQLNILHIYRFSRKINLRLHDLVPGDIKLRASDC